MAPAGIDKQFKHPISLAVLFYVTQAIKWGWNNNNRFRCFWKVHPIFGFVLKSASGNYVVLALGSSFRQSISSIKAKTNVS